MTKKQREPSANGQDPKPRKGRKKKEDTPAPAPPPPIDEPALLPCTLERLAHLCCGDDGRSILQGVHLTSEPGRFRAEASDGKVALVVQGTSAISMIGAVQPLRAFHMLKDAPNGSHDTVIPKDTWAKAMCGSLAVGSLAIKASEHKVTLSSGESLWQDQPVLGNFPHIDNVFPKRAPHGRAVLRIAQLMKLLKAMESVSPFEKEQYVMLIFHGEDQPLGLLRVNKDGLTLDGVIMPCEPRLAFGEDGSPPASAWERQKARYKKR